MKKFMIGLGVVAGVALIGFLMWTSTYSTITRNEETVKETWGQYQSECKRRSDLIPNLVATVKGYAAHERATFEAVTKARQQITSINLEGISTNEVRQQQFMKAQDELGATLNKLLAIREAYPELKANQNFLTLQDQIEGSENRITVARNRNQVAVKVYNAHIRGFWSGMVARKYEFQPKPYYEAPTGSENPPTVSFQ